MVRKQLHHFPLLLHLLQLQDNAALSPFIIGEQVQVQVQTLQDKITRHPKYLSIHVLHHICIGSSRCVEYKT